VLCFFYTQTPSDASGASVFEHQRGGGGGTPINDIQAKFSEDRIKELRKQVVADRPSLLTDDVSHASQLGHAERMQLLEVREARRALRLQEHGDRPDHAASAGNREDWNEAAIEFADAKNGEADDVTADSAYAMNSGLVALNNVFSQTGKALPAPASKSAAKVAGKRPREARFSSGKAWKAATWFEPIAGENNDTSTKSLPEGDSVSAPSDPAEIPLDFEGSKGPSAENIPLQAQQGSNSIRKSFGAEAANRGKKEGKDSKDSKAAGTKGSEKGKKKEELDYDEISRRAREAGIDVENLAAHFDLPLNKFTSGGNDSEGYLPDTDDGVGVGGDAGSGPQALAEAEAQERERKARAREHEREVE
jgi:hypothetical protein